MAASGDGALTRFPPLPEEKLMEPESEAQNQGVLSSFFGRIFKYASSSSSADLQATQNPSTFESGTLSPASEALHLTESRNSNEAGVETSREFRKLSLESLSAWDQRKFSDRLTSLFRSKKNPKLNNYNESVFKRYWMPDSTGKECYECQEKFTAFRRRHHCRLCGQIFCSKCSNAQIPGALLGYMGDLRLCSYCARIVESYLMKKSSEAESFFGNEPDPTAASSSLASAGTEILSHKGTPCEPEQDAGKEIATVSAGSLMWSGDNPLNNRSVSITVDPPMANLNLISVDSCSSTLNGHPSMFCVEQLAMQNRVFSHTSSDVVLGNSSSRGSSDEFEYEPEWVKRINMAQASSRMEEFNPAESFNYEIGPSMPNSNSASTSALTQGGINFEASSPSLDSSNLDSSSQEVPDETNVLFEKELDQMLAVLFNREQLSPEIWRPVLWPLSRQIARTVRVDVAARNDNMNVLNYVHVKKFLVSDPNPKTRVVHGSVCTKAISHSQMPCDIENASVLTLAGSIEYERVTGKLSTLVPIIAQEKDYLTKQIDRMMEKRPSVVVVENTVAKLAVDMLLEEDVCLISNVRTNVVARIARAVQADVLPSLDAQLLNQRIGFAPRFRQERIKLKNGSEKTILVFDECNPELGCSVLLFANSMRELRAAERILKFMISQWYSAKLEIAFLEMIDTKLLSQPSRFHTVCLACRLNRDDVNPSEDEDSFPAAHANTVLGNSPFIRTGAPFLFTSRGQKCSLRQYFKQHNLYRYAKLEEFVAIKDQLDHEEKENEEFEKRVAEQKAAIDENVKHPFLTNPKVVEVDEDQVAMFRALGGLVFRSRYEDKVSRFGKPTYSSGRTSSASPNGPRAFISELSVLKNDPVIPIEHQPITVPFGSYRLKSVNAPLFCVKPFYLRDDMCLGVFLHKFCFNQSYRCGSCNLSMFEHQRKIVHKRVRIEITTQIFVQQAAEEFGGTEESASAYNQQNGIVNWRYCPSCKVSSPVVPFSNDVWHLSFAKFLDYLSNGTFSTSTISHAKTGFCKHCTFHEHHHFFAHDKYVTTFKVTPIRPYHIVFSPIQCIVEPKMISRQAVVVNKEEMVHMGRAIFDQMQLYLDRFASHPEAPQHMAFHTLLTSLLTETRNTFEDRLTRFDPTNLLSSTNAIRSNDSIYINATEAVTWCRHYVYRLIEKWNEQSGRLASTIKALKKSSSSAAIESSNTLSTSMLDTTAAFLAGLTPDPEIPFLESPFASELHLSLEWRKMGVPVIVRDLRDAKGNTQPDIGSVIAYALASPMYAEQKKRMREQCGADSILISLKVSASAGNFGKEANSGTANSAFAEANNLANYQHLEVDFEDSIAQYYVKAYYAEQFRMLRKVLFTESEDQFIRSLSQSLNWKPDGGKSGASFFKTRDERFVFKQMSRFEIQSFVKFAPNYFDYIYTAVSEKKLTMLCKVYGVYRVAYTKKQTNQETKMDLLVMEYLFYRRKIKQTWDLKGSLRNRWASNVNSGTPVLLDENLVKDFWNNQLYVDPHSKAALKQAISNDSHFLSSQHVMDYSLLVGIDEENDEVILGIVDYMRTYSLDKKLESWVKIVASPGGQLPTVLSPQMYCKRFTDAIDIYFPIAPDQWTGIGIGINY
ncbi:hypothetical protein L596_012057 [Steinernema carpocapsae]|uniref:1-phosphatidylinositol-3-phosphate 5-kinase n=1 Tax=Steinernema carpocapsae TaxID=34508 RepID=A0A4U5NVW5_STECR|nr:hypothetical protein L596_012057 [Steinernema carpocapsae]